MEILQNGRAFPAIDMAATGRRITQLRCAAGLTVRDVQALMGFASPQAVYKWQRGEALPSLDSMTVLARCLGVTIEEIIVYQK